MHARVVVREERSAVSLAQDDVAACRAWIAHHSRSFYLSSLLLPRRVRQASWALYAFCRRADDAADALGESAGRRRARLERLAERLARVYGTGGDAYVHPPLGPAARSRPLSRPLEDPVDRAYAAIASAYRIPRALPEALLAGLEEDLADVRYATWEDLYRYAFRVASTVGLMMTLVMGWRREDAWLRAADLGIAMQLTNIARDVGEDARRGRVYLPDELLAASGTDRERVLAAIQADPVAPAAPALRAAVRRLLERAEAHYVAAERGIPLLPRSCRLAIASSRYIYADIGRALGERGYDPLAERAHTSTPRKLELAVRALPALLEPPGPPSAGPADALIDRLLCEVGLDQAARRPRV